MATRRPLQFRRPALKLRREIFEYLSGQRNWDLLTETGKWGYLALSNNVNDVASFEQRLINAVAVGIIQLDHYVEHTTRDTAYFVQALREN